MSTMPHTDSKTTRVFLSHSSKDSKLAEQICEKLESDGISCWIAPRDVQPGRYAESIIEGIKESSHFVLIFSKYSIESKDVQNEIQNAHTKGLVIIPFRIDNCKLNNFTEYFLGSHHWLNGTGSNYKSGVEQLRSFIGNGMVIPPGPSAKSSRNVLKIIFCTILLIVLAGVTTVYFASKPDDRNGTQVQDSLFPSQWHGSFTSKGKEYKITISIPQKGEEIAAILIFSTTPSRYSGNLSDNNGTISISIPKTDSLLKIKSIRDFSRKATATISGTPQCDAPFTIERIIDDF